MFQNILFIIEERELYERLAEVMTELAEGGRFVRAALGEEYPACMERWGIQEADTVIVTDTADLARQCAQKKTAVVAVLTEKNRDASMEGVPFALEGMENPGWDYFQKVYERCHGLPWTILETERCLVREICLGDLDRLYEIYAEPSVTRYMEGLFEDREKEAEYTRAYIRNMYGFYGYGMWIIEEKKKGRIIGRAGIENREEEEEPEIGYLIAREEQGKGYALEVCLAILDYAKEQLGFSKMACYVHPENEASKGLCRKLGFEYRGQKESGGKVFSFYEKIL